MWTCRLLPGCSHNHFFSSGKRQEDELFRKKKIQICGQKENASLQIFSSKAILTTHIVRDARVTQKCMFMLITCNLFLLSTIFISKHNYNFLSICWCCQTKRNMWTTWSQRFLQIVFHQPAFFLWWSLALKRKMKLPCQIFIILLLMIH